MTSVHREIDEGPKFSATVPHFFMKIPKGNCRDSKLGIPKKFVKKYGGDLSNPVFLEVPSGSKSKIELRRWDGKVWFGNGWLEFSDFYSLDYCHSLVFQYEGNSKFRVFIFDTSFTEIDYPLEMPEMNKTSSDHNSDDGSDDDSDDGSDEYSDDDSFEILDKFPPCPRKTRKRYPLPCPRPHKKNRTSSSGKDDFPTKIEGGGKSSTSRFLKQKQTVLGRMHPSTASGKAIALQRAKAFRSNNPFVVLPMQHSYIDASRVWLPSDFSNLMAQLSKSNGEVFLQVLRGRTWSVQLKYQKARAKARARFQAGWHEFVRSNNLKFGDVCVLVLIDDIRLKFEVVIYRATEAADCILSPDVGGEQKMAKMEETDEDDEDSVEITDDFPPCPKARKKSPLVPQAHEKNRTCLISKAKNIKDVCGSSKTRIFLKRRPEVPRTCRMHPVRASGKDIALQKATAFKSEYPIFRAVMHPSYILRSYMSLPAEFVHKHLNQTHGNVILRVSKERTWPVKVRQYPKGRATFQSGWMKFVQDNHLEIGDVCVFQLMNDIKPLFHVVLFRAMEAADCTSSPDVDGEQTIPKIEEIDEDDDECVDILHDFQPFPKTRKKSPIAPQIHKKKVTCSSSKAENNIKDAHGLSMIRKFQNVKHKVPRTMHTVTTSGNDIALQRANAFKSKYPSFKVAIRASTMRGCYLPLPAEFVHKHLKQAHDEVTLRVSEGRTWPVKLCLYSKQGARFQGCMTFVRGNNLKIGDACVFELINDIELVFDVVLFRTADCTSSPGELNWHPRMNSSQRIKIEA